MTRRHNAYVADGYWAPGYVISNGGALVPLSKSHAATDLEADLRDLFIDVFEQLLKVKQDAINVYGAPHLGGLDLVTRNIEMDGLSFIRNDNYQSLYYLLKSWKHLNPERGLHFLRTYVRAIFGLRSEVSQLWQKKSEPYPNHLRAESEVESETDYFLTSRVRVDLDTEIVPDRIVRTMRTAAPARLVLDVRIVKSLPLTVGIAQTIRGVCIASVSGETY